MFIRRLNKRGQSTAEYAILIVLVVAAVLAMQTYVKRALQARIQQETDQLGGQYEPYYLSSDFDNLRDTSEAETTATGGGVTRDLTQDESHRTGWQKSAW